MHAACGSISTYAYNTKQNINGVEGFRFIYKHVVSAMYIRPKCLQCSFRKKRCVFPTTSGIAKRGIR